MQLGDLAQRRTDDDARIGAGCAHLGELRFHLGRAAREGRIDDAVERERGCVGDDREHVIDVRRLLAVGVERELAHLAARGTPVAADQRGEQGTRVSRDREAGGPHLLVDQPRKLALAVDVAGQRGDHGGFLAYRAQRRIPSEIARLDDDAAVGCRRGRDQRFDRRDEIPPADPGPGAGAAPASAGCTACRWPAQARGDPRTGRFR